MGPGAGVKGGVSFTFLLGREKMGGGSCQDDIEMMVVRKQEAHKHHLLPLSMGQRGGSSA